MEQVKDIFSEFLTEEAIKIEVPEQVLKVQKEQSKPPHLPVAEPAGEEALKARWKQVRHFFRTGQRPDDADQQRFLPVLLSPYFKGAELVTDYPFFLAENSAQESLPLRDLLQNIFVNFFSAEEAVILRANLPRLENYFRKYSQEDNSDFAEVANKAFNELAKLEVHGAEGDQFKKDLQNFSTNLPRHGRLVNFSSKAPIYLLNNFLGNDLYESRKKFTNKVAKLRSAVGELLAVENSKASGASDANNEGFDFAGSMIEFGKINNLMPESASENMPAERLKRLQLTHKTLAVAEKLLLQKNAVILIPEDIYKNENYDWANLLPNCLLHSVPKGSSCRAAVDAYDGLISEIMELLAAVRISELELKDKFNEEIHTEFFNHFDRHSFTDEETALVPPVILINETQSLLDLELSDFSYLLASNKPVKIFAINRERSYDFSTNGHLKTDLYTFRQELAAIAVSHRDAYTFQSSTDNPLHLYNGVKSGLISASPALLNILVPSQVMRTGKNSDEFSRNSATEDYLKVSAAVEGRHFPRFTYDQSLGAKWGSRFDISANPAPEAMWPQYEFEVVGEDRKLEKINFTFTFADYFAMEPYNQQKLLCVEPEFWSDDLMPLYEYLEKPSDELYGKVPFIWMTDEEHMLNKIVVPFSVVFLCKERLDFWNFIQELGGVNSFHVQKAIDRTKKEASAEKEKEVAKLKDTHQQELDQVRSSAAGEAMDKLSAFLLDMGDLDSITVSKPVTAKAEPAAKKVHKDAEAEVNSSTSVKAEDEDEVLISSEPWLETIRCTSCNDCTDKFPHIFKYNDDKQAFIGDASRGKYEELVMAAEGCPADCIHPGLPKNPDDPKMESWIKRAEPFN